MNVSSFVYYISRRFGTYFLLNGFLFIAKRKIQTRLEASVAPAYTSTLSDSESAQGAVL
ncbi:unnamed protein product [Brassica napus]|uniref:(rape) hypothetical protein n=1 Tax=Brassica napus TaxID=3708 RepID=A0A816UF77_BRANA|nr:unnamed protein product [Brassica napus]